MPQKKLTSIEDVVEKLIDVSKIVKNRMGLKPMEEQRVQDAFALLAAGGPPAGSTASVNKKVYVDFLQRVQKILGLKGVVLCAIGLGVSAVTGMGDRFRVDLPHKMKEREIEIAQDELQNIANVYSAKFFPSASSGAIAAAPEKDDHFAVPVASQQVGYDGMVAMSQFTGDAYELTWDDVKTILGSSRVGRPYLIDTYAEAVNSFAIVPVSQELTNLFAMQRARV